MKGWVICKLETIKIPCKIYDTKRPIKQTKSCNLNFKKISVLLVKDKSVGMEVVLSYIKDLSESCA